MQTFLPYADPRASAACLDDRRLGKQRVETFQVLRAITWPTYGWKHHPVTRMWRGFVPYELRKQWRRHRHELEKKSDRSKPGGAHAALPR